MTVVPDGQASFYALSLQPEVPPLRPWLFRIAHNAALDFLKSHSRRFEEGFEPEALEAAAGFDDAPGREVVRAALVQFVALPVTQRCAVILKDVLGHSLEETAEIMETTVMAVKAALVRGRQALQAQGTAAVAPSAEDHDVLQCYASLFNARNWDGVRALISDDCKLDLVSKSHRRRRQVGLYFERYERAMCRFGWFASKGGSRSLPTSPRARPPAYFILLEVEGGKVSGIRDFRYVPYIANEALFSFEP